MSCRAGEQAGLLFECPPHEAHRIQNALPPRRFVLGEIEEARKMGLIELADLLALNEEEASALLGHGPGHILEESLLVQRSAALHADSAATARYR